ncbi:MAG: metalloregulator ArsR/SmtB family transcription factor [Planctomycetota bacterium]
MATTAPTSHAAPALLKVLADPTRLRALALVAEEELSVGELARALAMAQSRVSNHLRVLREHDLLAERRAGTSTYLRASFAGGSSHTAAARLWAALSPDLDDVPEREADRMRLEAILAERNAEGAAFFDRMAGDWDKVGSLFRTNEARQRAAASLLPAGLVLADLGCGTGYVARALVGLCDRLVCVDRSEGMLTEARERLSASSSSGTEVEFRSGELDALPLETDEVDGAVAAMVLHHLDSPDAALAEMHRAIRPGGTLSIVELMPHREAWVRAELGDHHLGLDPTEVSDALRRAGFEDVRVEPLKDDRYLARPRETRPRATQPRETQPGQVQPREASNDHGEGAVALPLYLVRGRVPRSS